MNFGWHTDGPTSQTIMDAALDAGIKFFDTANVYAAVASEESLGWIAPALVASRNVTPLLHHSTRRARTSPRR